MPLKDFLIGLLHLNFQIDTFDGKISCNSSLVDKEKRECEPFRSIVSKANKSKSNLSIDALFNDL